MNGPVSTPPQKIKHGKLRGLTISQLIEKLVNAQKEFGDLPVMMSVAVQGDGGKTHSMIKPVWKGDIGLTNTGDKVLVFSPGGEHIMPGVSDG